MDKTTPTVALSPPLSQVYRTITEKRAMQDEIDGLRRSLLRFVNVDPTDEATIRMLQEAFRPLVVS